ncbi:hypothetical protein AC249_AIPGENE17216 [Exaiptasia diaphana]|nr:hypothetical protein AC249_AIPGENE17216 [Exaiptasia diaphana]
MGHILNIGPRNQLEKLAAIHNKNANSPVLPQFFSDYFWTSEITPKNVNISARGMESSDDVTDGEMWFQQTVA